eukprot:6022995-Amphidinium_carterae.1
MQKITDFVTFMRHPIHAVAPTQIKTTWCHMSPYPILRIWSVLGKHSGGSTRCHAGAAGGVLTMLLQQAESDVAKHAAHHKARQLGALRGLSASFRANCQPDIGRSALKD